MATTGRTTMSPAAPTDSLRRTALVAGTFYLVTFVASIPALILIEPVLNNPDYVLGSGADTRVLLGCSLDMVNALACIGTAVVLFPLVRRQNETLALGFVTSRLFEAAVIVVGVLCLLSVVTLRQDLAGSNEADATSFATAGRSLVAVRDWTFLLGPSLMAGLNALLLGTLMYRSGLVPRLIPLVGLFGAPLLLASTTATFFGAFDQLSVWSAIATLPVAAWELSLGIWLVVKGFRPSPITGGVPPAPVRETLQEVRP